MDTFYVRTKMTVYAVFTVKAETEEDAKAKFVESRYDESVVQSWGQVGVINEKIIAVKKS